MVESSEMGSKNPDINFTLAGRLLAADYFSLAQPDGAGNVQRRARLTDRAGRLWGSREVNLMAKLSKRQLDIEARIASESIADSAAIKRFNSRDT